MTRAKIIALIGVLVIAIFWVCSCAHKQATQREGPKPFRYKYSTEELKDKFSEDMMKRAAVELREIDAVNAKGRCKPIWNSIDRHQAPECYREASDRQAQRSFTHSSASDAILPGVRPSPANS